MDRPSSPGEEPGRLGSALPAVPPSTPAAHPWQRFVAALAGLHPTRATLLGYVLYVVAGWILLCLPWSQASGAGSALDHLFTAVSAVSTTGLSTLGTSADYSGLGQVVILALIQLGGLGYMTVGSFIVLRRTQDLSPARAGVASTVFSLPEGHTPASLVRAAVGFTLVIEVVGAVALYVIFLKAGEAQPLWSAIFHSVSSFCTAGFSLHADSLERYASHTGVQAVVGTLSYLGALGFIVCLDAWRVVFEPTRRITLTTKVILWSTFVLTVAGTLLVFLGEPSLAGLPASERLCASWFQAMSALTTVGFNSVPIGALSHASLLVLTGLMIVGASPSGTGGGLKCTTFSAITGVMKSALRGEQDVRFWGQAIPLRRLWTAVATLAFYLASLLVGLYLLELCERSFGSEQLLFEAASALGTVGLSTGITAQLSSMGKLILIGLMFGGRMGPLALGVALFPRGAAAPAAAARPVEDLAV